MTHLHLHTSVGSRLDGVATSEEYAEKAKKFGQKAMAITDHGRMSGVIYHQKACLQNGIKPIFGVEAYLVDELTTLNEKTKRQRTKTNHVILLAKNKTGYKNLLKLNYLSYKDTEHYYYVNRITKQELFDNGEGLIVGTACLGSKWNRLILQGKIQEAEKEFVSFLNRFGENFYTEIQINEITNEIEKAEKGQISVNEVLLHFAKKYGTGIYIGGDVHYLNPGDSLLQTISIAIRNKETMDNLSWELESKNLFFHNENDYYIFNEKFGYNYKKEDIKSWIKTNDEIGEKCNYLIPERKKIFLPKLYDDDDKMLIVKAKEGLKKILNGNVPKVYEDRLNHELEIIIRKGFSSYLLILEDIFKFVKDEGGWYGPARGSGAASCVLYSLGITKIDPIKYNLIFERFMSEQRSVDVVYDYFGELNDI